VRRSLLLFVVALLAIPAAAAAEPTTSGGSGAFAATLTHYRKRIFGTCIAYRATVVGTARFAF
jgi:hypothetical protein